MILICDITVSERAKKLRKTLYNIGIPCACCQIDDIRHFVPFKLIVTFTDVFGDVRRTPFDDIRVICIGDGFVNSCVNAERVDDEHQLIKAIDRCFMNMLDVTERDVFRFGVRVKPNLYLSKRFMIINGKGVVLANAEYMIFKYLLAFADENKPISPVMLYQYCFSTHRLDSSRVSNNIAVDVKRINQKCEKVSLDGMVKSKRDVGYYLVEF